MQLDQMDGRGFFQQGLEQVGFRLVPYVAVLLGAFILAGASPAQAVCGDAICDFPTEDDFNCAIDCGCAALSECTENGGAVPGSICNCDADCVSGICCDDADTVCGVVDPIVECPSGPLPLCKQAAKSSISFKNVGNDKSKLKWKWFKGAATDISEFRDPVNTTDGQFLFCGYDSSGEQQPLLRAAVAPQQFCSGGADCWAQKNGSIYQYKENDDGIWSVAKVQLKAGENEKAAIQLQAKKGSGVFAGSLSVDDELVPPVTVQFIVRDSATNTITECWDATYNTPKKNLDGVFKAKTP